MSQTIALPDWVHRAVDAGELSRAEWWDEIGSTNNRALALSHSELTSGRYRGPVLVGATHQTAGRGRGTNVWWSRPGALTLSLIMRPADYGWSPTDDPCAAITTAMAIGRAAEAAGSEASLGLKWPNDVYCRGRKLAGLLVEPVPETTGDQRLLVVGLGVNVNNAMAGTPVESTAISLCETIAAVDRRALDEGALGTLLLRETHAAWRDLVSSRATFAGEWRSRCVLTGQRVAIRSGDDRIEGRCDGPDDTGGLLIATAGGRVRVVSGTVERVEPR